MQRGSPTVDRSIAGALTRLAPATLCVQLLSFGSSIALARQLGATTSTDAYYLALSVPAVAYAVLIAALRLGGIPILTRLRRETGSDFSAACSELVSATLSTATLLSIVVTPVMVIALPLAAAGSPHLTALTRLFIVELSPYALTGALLGALGAILAVCGRFVAATLVLAFEPLLKSLLVLAFGRRLGAQTLVIGSVVGNLVAVAILWKLVLREGVALRVMAFLASPVVRAIFKLSAPLIVSQSVLQLNPLIDRTTAASLGPGNVTTFELGVRLFTAPATLMAATLVAPLAATWSDRLAAAGWDAVARSYRRVLIAIVTVIPPISSIGFVARNALVDVIYRGHAYTALDTSRTAGVFGMLMLGLAAQVLIVPTSTLFVVRSDTIFPMKIGLANCVLNAALDVLLRGPFGVAGIAFSTTLTLSILAVAYIWRAQSRWGGLQLGALVGPAARSLASCAAICIPATMLLGLVARSTPRVTVVLVLLAVAVIAVIAYGATMLIGRRGRGARLAIAVKARSRISGGI